MGHFYNRENYKKLVQKSSRVWDFSSTPALTFLLPSTPALTLLYPYSPISLPSYTPLHPSTIYIHIYIYTIDISRHELWKVSVTNSGKSASYGMHSAEA